MRAHSRRQLLLGGAALAAVGLLPGDEAAGQQTGKVPRIGFLAVGSREGRAFMIDGFRRGLREHGYVEGQNLVIETASPTTATTGCPRSPPNSSP
jgi:hypothetical protein